MLCIYIDYKACQAVHASYIDYKACQFFTVPEKDTIFTLHFNVDSIHLASFH